MNFQNVISEIYHEVSPLLTLFTQKLCKSQKMSDTNRYSNNIQKANFKCVYM